MDPLLQEFYSLMIRGWYSTILKGLHAGKVMDPLLQEFHYLMIRGCCSAILKELLAG